MDPSSLLSSASIAHANPLLSLPSLLAPALGTGGGILGSSSSSTGTQGNSAIFGAAFQVGGRGNSSTADPTVSPTVSTAQTQPQAPAAQISGANLGLILGIVGVMVAVVALLKR